MIISVLYPQPADLTTWKHFFKLSGSAQWGALHWDWCFVCLCVFVWKAMLSIGLVPGPSCSCILQEAQSGRTRGSLAVLALVTHKAAQWDGSYGGGGAKMTWCVTETHHLSVIQVFEPQGCNAAWLVWRDLFQIDCRGRRGQWPNTWEVTQEKRSTLVEICVEGEVRRNVY